MLDPFIARQILSLPGEKNSQNSSSYYSHVETPFKLDPPPGQKSPTNLTMATVCQRKWSHSKPFILLRRIGSLRIDGSGGEWWYL
jgi:hypothetical protein